MAHVIKKIGSISSDSVLKNTGKSWDEWIAILIGWGASTWTYQEITSELKKKYKLNLWWTQWVAISFEIHIERREPGRNAKGELSLTVTKSIHVNGKKIWKFLVSVDGIHTWLQPVNNFKLIPKGEFETKEGNFGEIRIVKPPKRIRFTWQESNQLKSFTIQILIVYQKKDKTILIIQQDKILDEKVKAFYRAHWSNVVESVQRQLTK